MKPPRIGAVWRNGPDTRRPLTCAFETTRTRENLWWVAHNPAIAAGGSHLTARGSPLTEALCVSGLGASLHRYESVPAWLESTTSVATTGGVLIALYVAVWREPRKARADRIERAAQADEDRRRYDEQMAALQRAENDRIAAQARKVVPAVYRADLFGENIWTVRINNTSAGIIRNLAVRVVAVDRSGAEVPNGCGQANNQVSISRGMERIVSDALGGALSGAFQSNPMFRRAGVSADHARRLVDQQLGPEVLSG